MSILIKGIKLPTHPDELRLIIRPNGQVIICRRTEWDETEAIELPPHGRLIDAETLEKMCHEMQSIEWNNNAAPYSWAYAYESFENDIDEAPTIIEAEGE